MVTVQPGLRTCCADRKNVIQECENPIAPGDFKWIFACNGSARLNCYDLCDKAGCKVEFRTEKDDFVVVFYRNLREQWVEEQKNKNFKIPKHQNDVLDDVLEDVLEDQILKLLLENNKLQQKQLAQKTGRSIASVQRAMKKLSERGKIARIGGKRFGHWEVK